MLSRHTLLLALCFPLLAQAAIPLGPAHPVTARIPGLAAGRQDDAVVATSGRETLVAWRDESLGRAGVYVARLAADGSVVPGKQRWLTEDATSLAFTWTGQSYLVVWSSASSLDVGAMTIDEELRTLTAARSILRGGSTFSNFAWTGSRGAVAVGRTLLIFDRDGDVVSTVADVAAGLSPYHGARLAATDDAFAVFMEIAPDDSIVHARRYTTDGQALDPASVPVARTARIAEDWDVAFGDGRFALVTTHGNGSPTVTLRRFIFDTALQARELESKLIGPTSGAHVEWAGDRFVALWLDRGNEVASVRAEGDGPPPTGLYTLRLLPFTENGDSSVVVGPERQGVAVRPEEVWNGSHLTVVYTVTPGEIPARDIYAETADWRAGTSTRSAVAMSMQWQSMPAAAANGRTALLAWTEGVPDSDAMRIAVTPVTPGAAERPVVYLSDHALPILPVVVSTASMYLVLWVEPPDSGIVPLITMQRVSREGVVLDPSPAVVARGFSVDAAWNGIHAAVVWAPSPFGGALAARLTADGRLVDAVPIAVPANGGGYPRIASNGSDFMVVWPEGSDGAYPLPGLLDLHAARITAAGAAEAAFPVAVGPANQRDAAIASDGRDYLVAYLESDPEGGAPVVLTKKVLREGVLSGTTADAAGKLLAASTEWPHAPSIAGTGQGYVVAWEESTGAWSAVLRMAAVDSDGTATEAPATVAESDLLDIWPAVVTAGSRTGWLVYSMLEGDPVYGASMRLTMRPLGEATPKRRAVGR